MFASLPMLHHSLNTSTTTNFAFIRRCGYKQETHNVRDECVMQQRSPNGIKPSTLQWPYSMYKTVHVSSPWCHPVLLTCCNYFSEKKNWAHIAWLSILVWSNWNVDSKHSVMSIWKTEMQPGQVLSDCVNGILDGNRKIYLRGEVSIETCSPHDEPTEDEGDAQ